MTRSTSCLNLKTYHPVPTQPHGLSATKTTQPFIWVISWQCHLYLEPINPSWTKPHWQLNFVPYNLPDNLALIWQAFGLMKLGSDSLCEEGLVSQCQGLSVPQKSAIEWQRGQADLWTHVNHTEASKPIWKPMTSSETESSRHPQKNFSAQKQMCSSPTDYQHTCSRISSMISMCFYWKLFIPRTTYSKCVANELCLQSWRHAHNQVTPFQKPLNDSYSRLLE